MNEGTVLTQHDSIPEGLLDASAESLHAVLPSCSLLHLPGLRPQPLFVAVLLHGNETTGLQAVQGLLRRYEGRPLPRALSLFFGNLEAARLGVRRRDDQPDYNRIWPGTDLGDRSEAKLARQVVDLMTQRGVLACVDVHNNTGLNPHYACVDGLDHRTLQLAALFGRLCIYSTRPTGTCSAAFADVCPAVTLECGKPGTDFGAEHALEYLDACLHLDHIPEHPVARHDLDLYESVAQVLVPPDVDFGFGAGDTALELIPDLDRLNFTPVPAGFNWARVHTDRLPVRVINGCGDDVAARYFHVEDGCLRSIRPVMPSMLTLDRRAIRLDCLGYLMEPREYPGTRQG